MNIVIDSKVLGLVGTNCYLVVNNDTKEAVLIDPADSPASIDKMIDDNACILTGILLTHGHFDHIGAVDAVRQKYGVKVYAADSEEHLLVSESENLSIHYGMHLSIKADVWHQDGDILHLAGLDIKAIHTPGHTAGGTCYLLTGVEQSTSGHSTYHGSYYSPESSDILCTDILFSGDTLFCASVGRTDFPTGSMSELVRSIKDKIMILPDDTRVYPGHGEGTTVGYERVNNPYL